MKMMTEQHLINAFGGESQAHMRYLHFADQVDKENFQTWLDCSAPFLMQNIFTLAIITTNSAI